MSETLLTAAEAVRSAPSERLPVGYCLAASAVASLGLWAGIGLLLVRMLG